MIVHCMFEQSGTFKNEFIKLGYTAFDYDILNDFNYTDYVIDLFDEIHKAYDEKPSIFDNISSDDLIMAFFPCVRFEDQILLMFRGEAIQQKNHSDLQKLEYDLKLHKELSNLYETITKLAIVCIKRNIKLIIENPYSVQHYLQRYWCLKPSIVDKDRTTRGDYYKKPTQYWFINFKPKQNLIFEPMIIKPKKTVIYENKVNRSMISPEYANRFIKEYIL